MRKLLFALILAGVPVSASEADQDRCGWPLRFDGEKCSYPFDLVQLRNADGRTCGHTKYRSTLRTADWKLEGDRYSVQWDGVWWPVPEAAKISGNATGSAMVWISYDWWATDSMPQISCFMAPDGGDSR